MTHTRADGEAFRRRCRALLEDSGGDSEECTWRMRVLLDWWMDQMLFAAAGDHMQLMCELLAMAQHKGVPMEVIEQSSDEVRH